MRIAALLVLLVAGCPKPEPPPAGPGQAKAKPGTEPAPRPAAGVTVPPPLEDTALVKLCAPPAAAGAPTLQLPKAKSYDFSPVTLNAGRYGPRIQVRPRTGEVRSPGQVRAAVAKVHDALHDCWVWSVGGTWKPGAWAELEVAITFDPFGAPSKVDVTQRVVGPESTTQERTPLAECAADVLAGIRIPRVTRSIATARGDIDFRLIGTPPRGRRRPARPVPAKLPPDTCVHLADPAPVHELQVDDLLEVEAGTPPPDPPRSPWLGKPAVPQVRIGQSCATEDVDKNAIRRALYSNLGGYHACYVDALGRQPGLRGQLSADVVLGFSGEPVQVMVSGDGDQALHACMQEALGLIFVRPAGGIINNRFAFDLVPAPPATAPAQQVVPDAFVGVPLDVDALAARLAAAVPAGAVGAACAARVQVLRALAWVPWATDARVRAAVRDFAAFVKLHPDLDRCVTDAGDLFWRLAIGELRLGRVPIYGGGVYRGAGLAEALERSQELLGLLPALRRTNLGLFAAAALYELDEPDKATDALIDWFDGAAHDRGEIASALDLAGRIRKGRRGGPDGDGCNP
jgi:hypothetical protein